MSKYKIKVSFDRVLEVEAETLSEAREKAEAEMLEIIENKGSMYFNIEQYHEPINWNKRAENDGKNIADDIEEEIKKAVDEYKKENPKLEDEEWGSDDVDAIFEQLSDWNIHGLDIYDRAREYADGCFIYRNTDAMQEAMECINELSDFEETDKGLWEGVEEVEDIINYKATYTLGNAIMHEAEEAIKQRIGELLDTKQN